MQKKLLVLLFSLATLVLTSCGGGNQSSSTGSSVTAQATTATVSACNASASFGGAGPLLSDTTNPTLEACNAAIAFTCNASTTFGGTEPALTAATSPPIKTCIAVMNESNSNGAKVLVGQATLAAPISAACKASKTFGGTGPLLTTTTNPTLEICTVLLQLLYSNEFIYIN
jgi:hypothetical protein